MSLRAKYRRVGTGRATALMGRAAPPLTSVEFLQQHLSGGDSALPGCYDASVGGVTVSTGVDAFADARGAGFGPTLAFSNARPGWDAENHLITFLAASSQALRIPSGVSAFTPAAGFSFAIVLEVPVQINNAYFVSLEANGSAQSVSVCATTTAGQVRGEFHDSASVLGATVAAVFGTDARRLVLVSTSGSGGTGRIEAPNAAAATVAHAGEWGAANALVFGRAPGLGSQFATMNLRAVVALARAYTVDDLAALKAWATTYHAVSLV